MHVNLEHAEKAIEAARKKAIALKTQMCIAVVDSGANLKAFMRMDDAWVGSIDIAIAKARTAAFFSSDENALTSRIIGVLSQAHSTTGTGGAGPLWGIAGLVLGGLIAVLAMRRFPNTRKAAAAEPGQEEATEVSWSPSDELSWPVQRK